MNIKEEPNNKDSLVKVCMAGPVMGASQNASLLCT